MTVITVDLMGGLGNQLFQIASAYGTARALGAKFFISRNKFGGCGQGNHPNKYYSSIYKKVPICDKELIHDHTYFEEGYTYRPILHRIPEGSITLMKGYFQSENYFKEYSKEIKNLFTSDEENIKILEKFPELADKHDYCFIGVRRGDYITPVNSTIHNPCNISYYRSAMNMMNKERYYIASDDIEWCKEHFVGDQFRFIEEDDTDTFYAMALFNNYIIANSSYHWWGSFMSVYDSPRIIAPDKWLFGPRVRREEYWSIYRDGMEILERTI